MATGTELSIPSEATERIRLYELMQREAKAYCKSELVPAAYRGDANIANCVLAFNVAMRMRCDPLTVMQNLYIIQGKPSWSSAFLIATFNGCGRFASIKYRFSGTKGKDDWGCTAYTTELSTGEQIEGPTVTWKMATDEGWTKKNGSKWLTMPELMFRYRSAAFLIRTTAPEIGMGFQSQEETHDVIDVEAKPSRPTLASLMAPQPVDESPSTWNEAEFNAALDACKTAAEVDVIQSHYEPLAGAEAGKVAGACNQKLEAMKGGA